MYLVNISIVIYWCIIGISANRTTCSISPKYKSRRIVVVFCFSINVVTGKKKKKKYDRNWTSRCSYNQIFQNSLDSCQLMGIHSYVCMELIYYLTFILVYICLKVLLNWLTDMPFSSDQTGRSFKWKQPRFSNYLHLMGLYFITILAVIPSQHSLLI